LRPCCQRFIETSAPSAFFRTYAHLRSSKALPLYVVTGRPGRASGGFTLQRGPCARKDPKPPETRWIEVVQGRQSREPAIRSLSQPEHKKETRKKAVRDTCDPATIIDGGVEGRFSMRNGSGTTPFKGRSNGKILGLSTTVSDRWIVVVVVTSQARSASSFVA
jgi:hypothetical protein